MLSQCNRRVNFAALVFSTVTLAKEKSAQEIAHLQLLFFMCHLAAISVSGSSPSTLEIFTHYGSGSQTYSGDCVLLMVPCCGGTVPQEDNMATSISSRSCIARESQEDQQGYPVAPLFVHCGTVGSQGAQFGNLCTTGLRLIPTWFREHEN